MSELIGSKTTERIPLPTRLIDTQGNAAIRLYAELYRRGAGRDERAWVAVSSDDLAASLGYSRTNVNTAIGLLVRSGYLLVVRREHTGRGRHPVPLFHLSAVAPHTEASGEEASA